MENREEIALPNAEAFKQALEVAGSDLEVLQDLDESIKERAKRAGRTGEYKDVFSGLNEIIGKARYLNEMKLRFRIWDGNADGIIELERARADHQTYSAMKDFKAIEAQLEEGHLLHITMLYDINKNGQFVRGYQDGQRSLDPDVEADKQVIDTMDEAFHSWMVSQHMISKSGVIYDVSDLTADEEPKTKVDPKNFVRLLTAEQGGYVTVAKELSRSVQLSLQRQETAPAKEVGPV